MFERILISESVLETMNFSYVNYREMWTIAPHLPKIHLTNHQPLVIDVLVQTVPYTRLEVRRNGTYPHAARPLAVAHYLHPCFGT